MTDASPNSTPRRHRRGLTRTAAACQRCRRRKQKCDGKVPPCSGCSVAQVACVISDRWMLQQPIPQCQCDSLRSQLEAADHRYDVLQKQYDQLRLSQSNEPRVEEPTPEVAATASPQNRHVVSPDQHHSGRILRPTFSQRPDVSDIAGSTLGSAWELWGNEEESCDASAQSPAVSTLFGSESYTSLMDLFFERRWPYLPVLHKPTFVEQHLMPFLSKTTSSPITNFLVNIVCAIGATERSLQDGGHIHRQFFNEAAKDLYLVMGIDDFECIQCLLLLCMYGHNEPQSVSMWYTTGMALHLALGIDLHRKETLSGKSLLATEMSKRVFWSAYVMSCSICIHMGRPIGIQVSDITTGLPLQLTDEQLISPSGQLDLTSVSIPQVTDMSTFIHIIKLRVINARVYKLFHSIGCASMESVELGRIRSSYFSELNEWLITAPRYMRTVSTFQSTDWFQIAFHHAVLSLYRPSRAAPLPLSEDLRVCTESAIGLISSYSSLYARNKIKYTFVAIHSLFLAAVTMLYALRASSSLRYELTRPVIQTNISTFLTLFRGISNGRAIGEKCSNIVERLGSSILGLFDDDNRPNDEVDTEFQSWFGLQTHTFATPARNEALGDPSGIPQLQGFNIDSPWADLFTEGIDIGYTDIWGFVA